MFGMSPFKRIEAMRGGKRKFTQTKFRLKIEKLISFDIHCFRYGKTLGEWGNFTGKHIMTNPNRMVQHKRVYYN